MAEKFSFTNNNLNKNNKELLNIFQNDDNENKYDILSLPDYFNDFTNQLEKKIIKKTGRKFRGNNIEGIFGEISTAIKSGFDISQSHLLVANSANFSQDIVEGLQKGIYHIGESKEIAGDFRPVILDDKERIVKSFTLKKINNPTKILSDISTMSIQSSLSKMYDQVEAVARDVKYSIDFARRQSLSVKFFYARDRIMLASKSRGNEHEDLLKEADKYLMEGMTSIMSDIDAQSKNLSEKNNLTVSIKEINSILSYLIEDIEMLSRYVGMRIYLFNYRGKIEEAKIILTDYKSFLESLNEKNGTKKKYSTFELIHEYYPYDEDNLDFWLEKPKEMIKTIETCNLLLDQGANEIYYIAAGVSENEQRR